MKRQAKNTIAVMLLLLLIGLIAVVLNFNKIQSNTAYSVSNGSSLKAARHYKQKKHPSYNLNNVKPISLDSIVHAWRNQHDYRAIGQIAIADKNILLNIYQGVGNDELALGCGTFRPDQKMGQNNYPLAGHNMDDGRSYFSPLYTAKVNGRLPPGTAILLTDFKNVYFYKIVTSKFVSANNLNLTFNKKKYIKSPVLTLITCDWTGIGRLYVKGKLTRAQSVRSCSKDVKHVFNFD